MSEATSCLRYEEVRGEIRTGDLFFYRGKHPLSKVIRFSTKSPYSHVSLATWWIPQGHPDLSRLMVMEATYPRLVMHPASEAIGTYNGTVDWFAMTPECRSILDEERLLSEALQRLGLSYSVEGVLDNMLRLLGLPPLHTRHRDHRLFCSEFISEIMCLAARDPVSEPDLYTTPADLAASPFWQLRGRICLPVTEYRERSKLRRSQQKEAAAQVLA